MRVLIADDQVSLRSALRLLLEHETNIDVIEEAGSIPSLRKLLGSVHPDLLFLDWQLPGLDTNGARQRLTEELRAHNPQLYIVALTDDNTPQNQPYTSADAVINRAESPDRLLATVRHAVARRPQSLSSTGPDSHLF